MVNHTFPAINATLCPVNCSGASRVESQLDASETVAMEGFEIGASLDIVSSTLMAKWRHRTTLTAAEFHVMVRALLFELPLTRNPIRYI